MPEMEKPSQENISVTGEQFGQLRYRAAEPQPKRLAGRDCLEEGGGVGDGFGPRGKGEVDVPRWRRRAIALIGRVVSLRRRATMASLAGSLLRRTAKSAICQPSRLHQTPPKDLLSAARRTPRHDSPVAPPLPDVAHIALNRGMGFAEEAGFAVKCALPNV
jgi:hypothetical protein